MIGARITVIDNSKAVTRAVNRAAFKNMGHAAASIRKDAIASIEPIPGPSAPGTPPHTHRQRNIKLRVKGKKKRAIKQSASTGHLRLAVRYDVDKRESSAVIGPTESVIGEIGRVHEFGGEFRGAIYPARPFMGPALENNLDRFAADWQGSVGE